ncbi:hypothetical protein GCM10007067_01490 [Lysobacter bugurensis]|uniref:Uncharacterized protein n=1 Tax=Cognatilysobacter bugurensis TaxID=543356 RepID=A0A918SUA4_9GAMM|nr:hypothetical protein GCM10007067_01490 [Lysobacter bugurensis]
MPALSASLLISMRHLLDGSAAAGAAATARPSAAPAHSDFNVKEFLRDMQHLLDWTHGRGPGRQPRGDASGRDAEGA